MNKIHRIVFTMACLLTSLGGYSYKIVSMGSYPVDKCTVKATYNSNNVIAGTTDIPASTSNNVTIHITDITPGYYLEKIEYEYVTDLGQAQAPRRASGPGIQTTKGTISHNSSHTTHYAGDYGLAMPASDIIITAIFTPCTPITGATLHWDTWNGTPPAPTSITYDGGEHTANVYLGSSDLTVDENYTITTNNRTDIGSITPTITGVGTYCGTISGQTITIIQRTLTITPMSGQSKVYGEEDPTFTYTSVGLVAGDAITGALSRVTPSIDNVGTYKITQGTLTAGGNYTITFDETVDFTIYPKNLTSVALTITLDHDYFNDNGGVQKAQISTIKYGNTTLTVGAGNDYTYAYGDGVYGFNDYTTPDIYPINITFSGNYAGTKTVKYQIRPEVLLSNSDFRWRTFYEPTYNMMVPTGASGFQAYTVSDVNVHAVEVTDRLYIKAGVPMLLYKPGANYQFYPELVEPTDGHLSGWSASGYYKQNASDWYLGTDPNILNETKKVWVLVRDKFVRSMSGTLKANKCYLELSGPTPVSFSPELNLNPILTGIETPKESRNDKRVVSEWYTLDGRKIQGIPSKKGIYITNGKKIIIK